MSAQFARAPHQGRTGSQPSNPPHAALLIDFDNVTMGIRSDLTKELKNLLNSDIIKGKVAVQRAYADWRRYPQYIVPLAESSVDLIFAPAYGSAKKNATDIRLAIDALELVFVRPEIGTFILLSGDSDFSSLVLKLKEYGKYVVGVGIRESASDLLVQNCDEYYSYSALTGLTRAGEEAPAVSEDPWELVDVAIRQMADNDDVMRSDRLKQVLLELDANFDEKALGFTKFNKFLQEAANRGVLSLRKQENGQYEIAPADGTRAAADEEEQRGRRRRGGRGRRGREEREPQLEAAQPEPLRPAREAVPGAAEVAQPATGRPSPEAPAAEAPAPAAAPREAAAVPREAAPAAPRPEAKRGEAVSAAPPPEPRPARSAEAAEPAPERAEPVGNDLDAAYALLRRATRDAQRASGGSVARDSDVKRRLLELDPQWDESNLGFSKFSRFLRRAHDDEVVTLRKLENGNYEVAAGSVEVAEEPQGRGRRGRGREERRPARGREAEVSAADAQGVAAAPQAEAKPAAAAKAADTKAAEAAKPSADTKMQKPAGRAADAQPSMFEEPAAATGAKRPAQPIGLRRGSRGRAGAPSGPPPLFEGQTARPASGAAGKPAAAPTPEAAPAPTAAPAAAAAAPATPEWFPTEEAAAVSHLAGYKGVGRRSAEQLLEAFGAANLYRALSEQPERVREVLGQRRGETLLTAFEAERSERGNGRGAGGGESAAPARSGRRSGAKQPARKAAAKKQESDAEPAAAAKKSAAKKSGRGRRGGRRKTAPTK